MLQRARVHRWRPGAAPAGAAPARRRCSTVRAGSAPAAASVVGEALLLWAAGADGRYERLPVEVREHPELGRCLVAAAEVAADQVLLSVPAERVFASQPEEELQLHWAAEMALRLLRQRSEGAGALWAPWVRALPARVATPVEFTGGEVARLAVPSTVRAVLNMREVLEGCYCELQEQLEAAGCGWHDFLWAVQVLHSRCFYEPASRRHLAVPGVDMCNHDSTIPNASVRLVHSPGACQGLAALEEVAPAALAALPGGGSFFQLVAGPDGIPEGDEVTICYGPWPAEPFLLLFGFLPHPNPHDALQLFGGLQHMGSCMLEVAAARLQQQQQQQQQGSRLATATSAAAAMLLDAGFVGAFEQAVRETEGRLQPQQGEPTSDGEGGQGGGGALRELILGRGGVGARSLEAAHEQLHCALAAAARTRPLPDGMPPEAVARVALPPLGALLASRLRQLAAELEQAAGGGEGGGGEDDGLYEPSAEHERLAAAYTCSRAALAHELLRGLGE